MTVSDLIRKKDYDYIEWRITLPPDYPGDPDNTIFYGVSKSVNGELISLDGNNYSANTEILSYEKWSDEENNIRNGLTVVSEGVYE